MFQTLGISALINALIIFFVTRFYNKKDNAKKKEKKEEYAMRSQHEKDHEDIKSFIKSQEYLSSKTNDSLKELTKMMNATDNMMNIFAESLQILIRDRIIQMYNFYYLDNERKFLPIYVRESLDVMHKQYIKLGGNGIVDDFVNKLCSLPTRPEYKED